MVIRAFKYNFTLYKSIYKEVLEFWQSLTALKEIKEELKNGKTSFFFSCWLGHNIFRMAILPKLIYRINTISIKILAAIFFTEIF